MGGIFCEEEMHMLHREQNHTSYNHNISERSLLEGCMPHKTCLSRQWFSFHGALDDGDD
jgi:hypothetical protein